MSKEWVTDPSLTSETRDDGAASGVVIASDAPGSATAVALVMVGRVAAVAVGVEEVRRVVDLGVEVGLRTGRAAAHRDHRRVGEQQRRRVVQPHPGRRGGRSAHVLVAGLKISAV